MKTQHLALWGFFHLLFKFKFKEQIVSTYLVIWDVLHNVFPPDILHLKVSPDAIVDNDTDTDIDFHDYVTDVSMMLVYMNMLIKITMMMNIYTNNNYHYH